MAEGLLGGILGNEGEEPKSEAAAEAAVAAAAFAAAVAAIASRQDPEVARKTGIFLDHQSRLLEIQATHLVDEHELRLAELRAQKREGRIRRFGMRIRVAFQIFAAVVAALIGVGILVLVHDAFTTRNVAVEPFQAPPGLAAQGVTGTVAASGLLDELNRLQQATRTSAVKREFSTAWASEVKLAVPETGISIGEISRVLKARFGHDVHIDGDLIETAPGTLALTIRGDGVAPRTFTGASGELSKLTIAAAEYVYSRAEPVPWAYYLQNNERNEEAIEFCRATFASADKAYRPYLLNVWANGVLATGGSAAESLALYRAALKLKPDYWAAHTNIVNAFWIMGNEEGAWRAGEDLYKAAGGRPGRAPELMYANLDNLTWNLLANLNAITADTDATAGAGSTSTSTEISIADAQARLHNPQAAELALQTTTPVANDPTIEAMTHFVRGGLALDAGNSQRAVTEMEAFGQAYRDPAISSNYPGLNCWIAPAEEAAGHPERADAALKAAGTYVDCYRFRGDILDHRGDWPGAQKAYAAAVGLAPDLPAGYFSWGVALSRHGDLAAAEAKLKGANQRGPHWADPLKAWGDVLAKQAHWREAVAKYNEALKYAPDWAALKEARQMAAKPRT
jgi:tetratricopeptide (TPR) repeat protein